MDIEEIKKIAKNKIESDDLTKQVRRRIKETAWDKQNKREGFSEAFKPLISQFEKPEDPKTKNIFTQNQETRVGLRPKYPPIIARFPPVKNLSYIPDCFKSLFSSQQRLD